MSMNVMDITGGSKVVDVVRETYDYSMFNVMTGNRPTNKLHIARITTSMEKEYLFSPIIVNEKYEIIDGQHRFEAAKSLNLPINYIICEDYGLDEVHALNQNVSSWSIKDFLNGYANMGKEHYVIAREFIEDNSLPVKLGMDLLSNDVDGVKRTKLFVSGDWEVTTMEYADGLLDGLNVFYPFDGYLQNKFIKAFQKFYDCEYYDPKIMVRKLVYQNLQKQADVTNYVFALIDIYNHNHRSGRNRLTYDKKNQKVVPLISN